MRSTEIPLSTSRSQSTNPDPLLDSVALTQGGMPHLIELMVEEYRHNIDERNVRLHDRGLPPENAEEVLQAATPLLDFFREYLELNRPVQCFPIDENYGLLLANNRRCAISPGVNAIQGTMQDSGAIGISTGLSQPGQGMAPHQGGYAIR